MNPFTEGLYVILRRNRYVGREGETQRERGREQQQGERERGKKRCSAAIWILRSLLTNTHTYTYTPQPTSRLYVSFGLEVWDDEGSQEGAVGVTHPPQSTLRKKHREKEHKWEVKDLLSICKWLNSSPFPRWQFVIFTAHIKHSAHHNNACASICNTEWNCPLQYWAHCAAHTVINKHVHKHEPTVSVCCLPTSPPPPPPPLFSLSLSFL